MLTHIKVFYFPLLCQIEQDFSVLWPEHEDHLYEKWDLYYNGIIEYGKQVENWQGILGLEYVNLESLSIGKCASYFSAHS